MTGGAVAALEGQGGASYLTEAGEGLTASLAIGNGPGRQAGLMNHKASRRL